MIRKRSNHAGDSNDADRASLLDDHPFLNEDATKVHKRLYRYGIILTSFLILFVVFMVQTQSNKHKNENTNKRTSSSIQQQSTIEKNPSDAEAFVQKREMILNFNYSSLEHCIVKNPPKQDTNPNLSQLKPFWFPQYPNSVPDSISKGLVQSLTGTKKNNGAKAYYAQTKSFRRCQGNSEPTVACLLSHPLIPMRPSPDDQKFSKRFNSEVVYMIRNPITDFPAKHNSKINKYNGHKGQTAENDWNKVRDQYIERLLEEWTVQLNEWYMNLQQYNVSLFIPFERIVNPIDGPKLAKQLADLFRIRGGYVVADDDDIPCIWYTSIGGKDMIQQYQTYHYHDYYRNEKQDDTTDGTIKEFYIPGYKQEQLDFLYTNLESLKSIVRKNKGDDDTGLVSILTDYQQSLLYDARVVE